MTAATALAARLLAVDPAGLGGALVRAARYDHVDEWLASLRDALPERTPMRRLPLGIPDDRLLGGIDLALTLAEGRPVAEQGVLAASDGGVIILPSAERASEGLQARLAQALDTHSVPAPRGLAVDRVAARIGVIALDEGDGDDERVGTALADRLAFHLALDTRATRATRDPAHDADERADEVLGAPTRRARTLAARARLEHITIDDDAVRTLVALAVRLGIDSMRAVLFAMRVARANAALDARPMVGEDDLAVAASLVLGPRATRFPAPEDEAPPEQLEPETPDENEQDETEQRPSTDELKELEETLIRAALTTLPKSLLASADAPARPGKTGGRSGEDRAGGKRGRQVGTRRGDPRSGGRLDLLETLRAAAPWQRIRRRLREAAAAEHATSPGAGTAHTAPAISGVSVQVRRDDFRLRRLHEPAGTTALFCVDASGSAAVHRMAEAKGAVELLLAESYARRDEVGLVAFRGSKAEVLLPPTRAIAAAKRALAALPGGGGTPLASAIDRMRELVAQARRTGQETVAVFLTDARANIARDGTPGRPQAESDALASAAALRAMGGTTILIDTAPRPGAIAERVAAAMGARYVTLPRTDAREIHAAVSAAMPGRSA
ncbi:MAG: magnesium chelatase subunit D [Gemmatimonadaceae bacterium]